MSRDTSEAKRHQADAILAYLRHHKDITVSEADRILHVGDGRARIRDLRHRGWPALDEWCDGENEYGKTRYKRYFLASCKDCANYERCRQTELEGLSACQEWYMSDEKLLQ